MRIAMGVEYDGSLYHGFQAQTGTSIQTVQYQLERALSAIANHAIRLTCAGRTDAGVHAFEQVIHFDTHALRDNRAWVLGTNAYLPSDIKIAWALPVPDDFHARFSASDREYLYVVNNEWTRPALYQKKVTWVCQPLNREAMQQAADQWLGQHDFSAFRSSECQAKSPVRTLKVAHLTQQGSTMVVRFKADAFLHHMVRNMMGVLIPIGRGLAPVDWALSVLEQKNRALGGITAPPYGLYLNKINYPSHFGLPSHGRPLMFF